MTIAIPLSRMTTPDKLRALEEIWQDLQRVPKNIPSPAWHRDVLRARTARIKEGSARYGDWADAKRRIRERIQ